MQDTVGIVIRTLNEAELIGMCLEVLGSQRTSLAIDILVVDSGSTDATVDIARSHDARILEISPDDFDYSKALNVGIEAVRGDLILILSAHAIPTSDSWISTMTAAFADPQVAGVAGRQLPWPDATWREALRLATTFDDTRREFTQRSSEGMQFSNAASCIRRTVWEREPFTLPAAEDAEWAQRVVAGGWSVVYEPAAAVHHSHRESPRAQAQRIIDVTRVETSRLPRTRRRTVSEAAGLCYRDGAAILGLDEPLGRRLAHLVELAVVASFYVLDFSRAGTTAERRRAN